MNSKKSLVLLSCLGLLASCGSGGANSSENSSDASSSQEASSIISSEEASSQDSFVTVDWSEEDAVSDKMTLSDTFLDVAVGCALAVGTPYVFSYGFSGGISVVDSTVEIDSSIAKFEKLDDGSFKLTPLKQGETIIRVKDSTGYLRYREKLTFRNPLSEDDVISFLVDQVDYYQSCMYAGMYIYFIDSSSGTITGSDEGVDISSNPITFTYELSGVSTTVEHEYRLQINEWTNNSGSTLTVVDMYLDFTGYQLHPMTSTSVVDLFVPVMQ